MKPILKQIKTKRLEYGFIRLDFVDDKKRSIPLLGLWRKTDRIGTYYTNDRNGHIFKTIKNAKKYCINNFNSLI